MSNNKSKYIIIQTDLATIPVVFGDLISHVRVAYSLVTDPDDVIAAGFCYIDDNGRYVCYGESVSLRVKSRGEEDSSFLNKYLGIDREY